jgi:hypothetical protein
MNGNCSNGGNSETQTTSNNHKYGDVVDQNGNFVATINTLGAHNGIGALTWHNDLANASAANNYENNGEGVGIYTNGGGTQALDGSIIKVDNYAYIRDTRTLDNGSDTGANKLNDGVNLDGTPNSGAESNEIIVGTAFRDLIYAGGGDDTVYGEGGNDIIYLGKRAVASRAYVGAFNFKGSDQQKKVGILSGGERNRVHLAKMLKSESNVLLLDEPTNDLDVDTLRALEEALMDFAGCAVVISHDRWFLDRLATHILAFEGDSHVEWFEGNFQAYEEDKRRRLGADATEPHRIKYRPLAR